MKPEKHLEKALDHAEKAKEGFEDGSKYESVADNAYRWTKKAVDIVKNE